MYVRPSGGSTSCAGNRHRVRQGNGSGSNRTLEPRPGAWCVDVGDRRRLDRWPSAPRSSEASNRTRSRLTTVRMGICNVQVDWWLKRVYSTLFAEFERLGIAWANCFRPQGAGNVYLTLDSIGGMVDEEGRAVADWIGAFLRSTEQADVLTKLARSNAAECHVVVPVGWGGAPWSVESYLTDGLAILPSGSPELPRPVTAAWIVSMHANHGIRWDGAMWHRFDARSASVAA